MSSAVVDSAVTDTAVNDTAVAVADRGGTVADNVAVDVVGARAMLRDHAKSFRFAGLFLPRSQLDDAAVIYAFCRTVDDAIDEAPTMAQAQAEAKALADELDGRASPRPAVRDFLVVAARIGLDVGFARSLVDGVAFDANTRVRVTDDAGLLRYCYLVAGTVGGMMCAVLGVKDPRALPHAIDLGIGMQLTNICRDVLEDARRDRVYVPAARLIAAGITDADGVPAAIEDARVDRGAVSVVVRDLLAVADAYYASADAGMHFIPWRSRLAMIIASRVYGAIGHKLVARGADPLAGRTSTTLAEKLWRACCAAGAFVRLAWRSPLAHDPALHQALRDLPGTNQGLALMPRQISH